MAEDHTPEQKRALLAQLRARLAEMEASYTALLLAFDPSREQALARTNFDQGFMWLDRAVNNYEATI